MLANRTIDRHLLPIVFVAGNAAGHLELECPALDQPIREKVDSFRLGRHPLGNHQFCTARGTLSALFTQAHGQTFG
jgi:hypothetical protein